MATNSSFPIDDTMLNATRLWPLAASTSGLFELPYDTWGVVVFVGMAVIAASLIVGYCYAPGDLMGLGLVLSLLLLSVPVSNLFLIPASLSSSGDKLASNIIGVVQVCLFVAAWCLTCRIVAAAITPKKLTIRTKIHMEMDGKEYPHEHVGCNKCGEVLSLEYFFSCQTCTKSKTGCQVAYELCQKCVFDHPKDHEILYWENGKCHGLVDFEATKMANLEEAQALLAGHDVAHAS